MHEPRAVGHVLAYAGCALAQTRVSDAGVLRPTLVVACLRDTCFHVALPDLGPVALSLISDEVSFSSANRRGHFPKSS